MSHIHKDDAKRTKTGKLNNMVGPGAADRFIHPDEKASNLAYTENKKLDPLPKPNRGPK